MMSSIDNGPVPVVDRCSVFLRVLGNDGVYPRYRICTNNHMMVCDGSVAWSAVREAIPETLDTGPQVSWLWPEEIRLFAAVSLVEGDPFEWGRFCIHPWSRATQVNINAAFGSDAFVAAATKAAHSWADSARSADRGLIPQRADTPNLRDLGTATAVRELIEAIDVHDELLIRGLSRFLAANHLIAYGVFFEESAVTAYISLEAALEYIRQYLEETSGVKTSFKEVFEHIREIFPTGEPFADVLESDYEARILMIHPSSRFGEYWTPPVEADECFEVIYSLIYLYRYIVLGSIWNPAEARAEVKAKLAALGIGSKLTTRSEL